MQRKNGTNRTELLFAIACVILASSTFDSGCTNHGPWHKSAQKAANAKDLSSLEWSAPRSPSPSPTIGQNISGNWLCDDSQCSSDTVKTISRQLDTIETTSTEYLAPSSPQSICKIHQRAHLTIHPEDSSGQVTQDAAELVADPENTRDCGEAVEKMNQSLDPNAAFHLDFLIDSTGLTINGVHYRHLSDAQLAEIRSQNADRNVMDASISGTWDCIDAGSEDLKKTISGDRMSITTDSIVELPENGKCHVREISKIAITDNTDPQKIYASRTRGTYTLVKSGDNSEKCREILSDFNTEKLNETGSVDQFALERDGNQELIIDGRRFVRERNRS